MSDRSESIEKVFELLVLLGALAVVPVVLIERHADSPAWQAAAYWANWVIWLIFVAEYIVLSSLATNRWTYTKRAWLDVFIIVSSFPLWPTLLASTRLARLAWLARALRILRLVRVAAVLTRGAMALRRVFRERGIGYLAGLTGLLTLAFGCLFVLAEPEIDNVIDGLWWAVVTMTTVGYGDVYPSTVEGRIIGMCLMLVGVGFVATLTGAIAANYVDSDEDEVAIELRRLNERLARLEELLAAGTSGARGSCD